MKKDKNEYFDHDNAKKATLPWLQSICGKEWRRRDRGPRHGIIVDSFGFDVEEILQFQFNATKLATGESLKVKSDLDPIEQIVTNQVNPPLKLNHC